MWLIPCPFGAHLCLYLSSVFAGFLQLLYAHTDGYILILGTERRSHALHPWQLVPFLKWKMSLSS